MLAGWNSLGGAASAIMTFSCGRTIPQSRATDMAVSILSPNRGWRGREWKAQKCKFQLKMKHRFTELDYLWPSTCESWLAAIHIKRRRSPVWFCSAWWADRGTPCWSLLRPCETKIKHFSKILVWKFRKVVFREKLMCNKLWLLIKHHKSVIITASM